MSKELNGRLRFNYSNRTYIYLTRRKIMDKIMKLLLQSSMCKETHFHSLVNSTGTAETSRSFISTYIAISTLIEHTRPLIGQPLFVWRIHLGYADTLILKATNKQLFSIQIDMLVLTFLLSTAIDSIFYVEYTIYGTAD